MLALFETPIYERHLRNAIADLALRRANGFTSRVKTELARVKFAVRSTRRVEGFRKLAGQFGTENPSGPPIVCSRRSDAALASSGAPARDSMPLFTLPAFPAHR